MRTRRSAASSDARSSQALRHQPSGSRVHLPDARPTSARSTASADGVNATSLKPRGRNAARWCRPVLRSRERQAAAPLPSRSGSPCDRTDRRSVGSAGRRRRRTPPRSGTARRRCRDSPTPSSASRRAAAAIRVREARGVADADERQAAAMEVVAGDRGQRSGRRTRRPGRPGGGQAVAARRAPRG